MGHNVNVTNFVVQRDTSFHTLLEAFYFMTTAEEFESGTYTELYPEKEMYATGKVLDDEFFTGVHTKVRKMVAPYEMTGRIELRAVDTSILDNTSFISATKKLFRDVFVYPYTDTPNLNYYLPIYEGAFLDYNKEIPDSVREKLINNMAYVDRLFPEKNHAIVESNIGVYAPRTVYLNTSIFNNVPIGWVQSYMESFIYLVLNDGFIPAHALHIALFTADKEYKATDYLLFCKIKDLFYTIAYGMCISMGDETDAQQIPGLSYCDVNVFLRGYYDPCYDKDELSTTNLSIYKKIMDCIVSTTGRSVAAILSDYHSIEGIPGIESTLQFLISQMTAMSVFGKAGDYKTSGGFNRAVYLLLANAITSRYIRTDKQERETCIFVDPVEENCDKFLLIQNCLCFYSNMGILDNYNHEQMSVIDTTSLPRVQKVYTKEPIEGVKDWFKKALVLEFEKEATVILLMARDEYGIPIMLTPATPEASRALHVLYGLKYVDPKGSLLTQETELVIDTESFAIEYKIRNLCRYISILSRDTILLYATNETAITRSGRVVDLLNLPADRYSSYEYNKLVSQASLQNHTPEYVGIISIRKYFVKDSEFTLDDNNSMLEYQMHCYIL